MSEKASYINQETHATTVAPQPVYPLDRDDVKRLKEGGLIGRAHDATQAVIGCATCPHAEGPVYGYQIRQCSDLPSGTITPLLKRLEGTGVLENRRNEDIDPHVEGRPRRVFYDVSEATRQAVQSPKPLPGCINQPKV